MRVSGYLRTRSRLLGRLAAAMRFGIDGPAASAAQPQVPRPPTPPGIRPRSTTRPSWPSPSTTRTSRSCATSATLQLPRGTFDLQFMDIAATVNPATVHFRSLTEPARVERARAELRVRPARARQAAAQVRRPRRHARAHAQDGGTTREEDGDGAAPQLQQRAGLADRQRDRHRPARRSHPLPRAARQSLLASDADLVARQRAAPRGTASRRRISPPSCRGTPTTC